ncbi:MAG TPA: DUF6580 family putative transport protein [Candidatus Kapabacteria bacterium]|nr:DUF6580 family putative transport protein [Candidatus Kapabacteria bacterium]
MTKEKTTIIGLALLLLGLGIVARLLPHSANVAPIAAIALFGALYLPKRLALILPLCALLLSDLFIGFYSLPIMVTVYGSFLTIGLLGLWIRSHKSFGTVLGGTLLGSLLFFLTTNAAVCFFGTMYAHTLDGLMQSYTMALPFFRNSVLGDLFYTGILVGSMELLLRYLPTGILAKEPEQIS